jgi:dolichyl-phosphate-mannose-protein mannosyltransferase
MSDCTFGSIAGIGECGHREENLRCIMVDQRAASGRIGLRFAAALFVICAAGVASVALGPDDDWDLLYYHLYAPFAYLHHRYLYDIGPAQSQGFLNPMPHLLFYAMISSRLNEFPRIIAFVMGAVHGINAVLVLAIARECLRPPSSAERRGLWIIAVLIGVTGAGFVSLLGLTTNDLINSMFVLGALLGILRAARHDGAREVRRDLAVAGLATGIGVGLKYTAAVFAPGLALVAVVVAARRRTLAGPLWFGGAAVLGYLVVSGHHQLTLWRDFGNPLFPWLNDIFHSPYCDPQSLRDMRFIPGDLWRAITYPFTWMTTNRYVVTEYDFRDWRGAIAWLAIAAVLVMRIAGIGRRAHRAAETPGLGLVMAFVVVSFFIWEFAFGIYRYGVALEMLCGIVIVGALIRLIAQPRLRLALAVMLAAIMAATTIPPDWGRGEWGDLYVDVHVPALPAHSIVLIATEDPAAYFIPFAEPTARYLGIENNYLRLSQTNLLASEVRRLMRTPGPPKFILSIGTFDPDKLGRVLDQLGLSLAPLPCLPIESNLATDDGEQLSLCPVADTVVGRAQPSARKPTTD